jgi:hypothetical protein
MSGYFWLSPLVWNIPSPPLGKTLIEPIIALRLWAEEHLDEVEQARIEHDQTEHLSIQDQVASIVQQR